MSKNASGTLLSVRNLTMRFGGLTAIDDLSLEVPAGKITGIIGPNGAGKTTLFNCLTGFYKPTTGTLRLAHPTRGEIRLEALASHLVTRRAGGAHLPEHPPVPEDDGAGEPDRRPAQRAAARVEALRRRHLQIARLPRGGTAGDRARGDVAGAPDSPISRMTPRATCLRHPAPHRDRARAVRRSGAAVPGRASRRPQSARIGRTQRAAALPVRRAGIAILLIEHDMSVVMNVSDHIGVISYGRKIAEGTPEQVQHARR